MYIFHSRKLGLKGFVLTGCSIVVVYLYVQDIVKFMREKGRYLEFGQDMYVYPV